MTLATWTDERVESLKQLWADGYSASVIADKLGGVTRNAVIGKCIRLGLPRRGKASPTRPRRAAPRLRPKPEGRPIGRPSLSLPPLPLPPPAVEDVARIATLDLEAQHCRWVVGDPIEVGPHAPLFCGTRKVPGLPYCEVHARRAYATTPISVPTREVAQAPEMEAVA